MERPATRKLLIDPRDGDMEDDSASTRERSFLALAGNLLVEVNLVKLLLAILIMIALPAVVLGLMPLLITGWYGLLSRRLADLVAEVAPWVSLALLIAIAWVGGRPLLRTTERSFWSLTSILVQPTYAMFCEGLRFLSDRLVAANAPPRRRVLVRAAATLTAGLLLCGVALWAVYLVWPASRWSGNLADLRFPQRLIVPTLANSVVIVGVFFAAAALFWSVVEATMEQPRDMPAYDPEPRDGRVWRVAQLSDLHMVGGPYEFRLESGRGGPKGNDAATRALAALARAHAKDPVDLVLMTGDMTDAGRSTEWAAFLNLIDAHPDLASRILMLPGNHDLNVVDRSNPARLELPTGTGKVLREMRALSALVAVQGTRVLVMDRKKKRFALTLADAVAPHADAIARFAVTGSLRLSIRLGHLWDDLFPMILPPDATGGLGVILLNSNAEAHFSFTNALGLIPSGQSRDLDAAIEQFPGARWIIGLHHHLIEYPRPGSTFGDRIGTALINGVSFIRHLQRLERRIVAMHGHRHIDWVGVCGPTRLISAPSPVMSSPARGLYIHRMAPGPGEELALLAPQKLTVRPEPSDCGKIA